MVRSESSDAWCGATLRLFRSLRRNLTADATNRRRIAHFPRVGVSVVTVATFAALVLGKRTALRGGRISSRQVR
jgi:hypothetical protein